jgi:hypothetical protein
MYHPGAHFVPRGKIFQEAILDFIMEWLRIDATDGPGFFEQMPALVLDKVI